MASASASIRTAPSSASMAWARLASTSTAAHATPRAIAAAAARPRLNPSTSSATRRHRLLSSDHHSAFLHTSRRAAAPHMDAEPAVVKSPSDPPNPASWPGKQKSTRGNSAGSFGAPDFGQQHMPAAESSKAAIEREQRSAQAAETSTPTSSSQQEDGACATLSPSSPAGPRSQQPAAAAAKGKETSDSSAPKAVAPEATANATSSPSTTPSATSKPTTGRAFRAKKAALSLTPTAVERLRDLLESDSGPRLIRIGVKQKGCAGMSYHLEYITPDQKGRFDEQVKQDGVEVLIDSKALFSIIGSVMDWQEDSLSAKFVFDNPNVSASCGCGESWMV